MSLIRVLKRGLTHSDPVTRTIAIMGCVAAFLATLFFAIVIYHTIDIAFTPAVTERGVVVRKTYYPPYTSQASRFTVEKQHPARFVVRVKTKDGTGIAPVSESFYERVSDGDPVEATYNRGRLSGTVVVISVQEQ